MRGWNTTRKRGRKTYQCEWCNFETTYPTVIVMHEGKFHL
jgi:hypothetical protein